MHAFPRHAGIRAKTLSIMGLQNTHMSILSVSSMKTARIMDGSMRLKLTKHQNESLLIYNGKSERICKATLATQVKYASQLLKTSCASYAKGLRLLQRSTGPFADRSLCLLCAGDGHK